jgi:hypothetical protein
MAPKAWVHGQDALAEDGGVPLVSIPGETFLIWISGPLPNSAMFVAVLSQGHHAIPGRYTRADVAGVL